MFLFVKCQIIFIYYTYLNSYVGVWSPTELNSYCPLQHIMLYQESTRQFGQALRISSQVRLSDSSQGLVWKLS